MYYAENKNYFLIVNGFSLKKTPFRTLYERHVIKYELSERSCKMSVKITEQRRNEFCCYYVMLGDPEEAAVRAGWQGTAALTEAAKLLKNQQCRKVISELKTLFSDSASVKAGLRRLAFGSCKDAVTLAFSEELPPPGVIEKLDLFNVSEIKRVKGGGVEIKLFDRLKALEKLYELETAQEGKNMAAGLLEALTASAGAENHDD